MNQQNYLYDRIQREAEVPSDDRKEGDVASRYIPVFATPPEGLRVSQNAKWNTPALCLVSRSSVYRIVYLSG